MHTIKLSSLWSKKNYLKLLCNNMSVSAIFMDLSKVFDTPLRFFAKSFLHNYLNKRLQRTNISCDYSLWKEISSGITQRSIFVPPLFNICINDILFFAKEAYLSYYADENALYSVQKNHIVNQSIFKKKFTYL